MKFTSMCAVLQERPGGWMPDGVRPGALKRKDARGGLFADGGWLPTGPLPTTRLEFTLLADRDKVVSHFYETRGILGVNRRVTYLIDRDGPGVRGYRSWTPERRQGVSQGSSNGEWHKIPWDRSGFLKCWLELPGLGFIQCLRNSAKAGVPLPCGQQRKLLPL